ncbi:hypothetical protein [Acinetobacter schindleri]|uniref:hypothetical protein n=1 Tax=Acinetobacter schindleri TaxID=108981 RepID=UPI002FE31500
MNLHNLLQNMDKVKLDQNPLPSHYICDLPETEKDSYLSTLVASAILLDTNISENKNRLFNLFLEACHTKSNKGKLFDLAQKIDSDSIKIFIRFASEQSFKYSFFVDLIVFLRLDSQINQEQQDVLNQWVSLLDIDAEQVSACMYIACNVLGLKHQNILKNTFPIEEVKVWRGFSAQRLDATILQKGLTSGYWYLDEDINIHKNWKVENSIIEFRNNSSLISDNEADVYINISSFIDSQIVFENLNKVNIEHCFFTGSYEKNLKATVIKLNDTKAVKIISSKFIDLKARAILLLGENGYYGGGLWGGRGTELNEQNRKLYIDDCLFENCIASKLMGGALCAVSNDYRITNSKFINCAAKLGGALRVHEIQSDCIDNCYFEKCLSLHFQNPEQPKEWNNPWHKNNNEYGSPHLTNGGAIYSNESKKHDSGVIYNSKFLAANVYLGERIISDYHIYNTAFIDSLLTYSRYSDACAPGNGTIFEKGEYKLGGEYYNYCKPLELDWIENYEGETSFDARSV